MKVEPMPTVVGSVTRWEWILVLPTKVPLVEPRSVMSTPSSFHSMRAWWTILRNGAVDEHQHPVRPDRHPGADDGVEPHVEPFGRLVLPSGDGDVSVNVVGHGARANVL